MTPTERRELLDHLDEIRHRLAALRLGKRDDAPAQPGDPPTGDVRLDKALADPTVQFIKARMRTPFSARDRFAGIERKKARR